MTMIILMIIYPQDNDNDDDYHKDYVDENIPSGTPSPSDFRLRQCRSHGTASHSAPLPDDDHCNNYHHDGDHHYHCDHDDHDHYHYCDNLIKT